MEYNDLGALRVSAVGLGCNNFGSRIDQAATQAVVDAAIDAGVTYFDTAEAYGNGASEELLGRAIADRRAEVVIATKWGHPVNLADGERGGDPALIRQRLTASLARLGTDHVDHYQLHRPDPETPFEETLGCLAELRDEGLVREIGCTHFSAEQLSGARAAADAAGVRPFASVQNHYSLFTRDPERDGVFDVCDELGIAFVPYFPLESGLLTGKVRRGEPLAPGTRLERMGERAAAFVDDERIDTVERLIAWSEDRGRSLLELAISWHTSHPLVASVIAGATTPEQVRANVAASGWDLADEDRLAVDRVIAGEGATPA